jgi:hypothetical protein
LLKECLVFYSDRCGVTLLRLCGETVAGVTRPVGAIPSQRIVPDGVVTGKWYLFASMGVGCVVDGACPAPQLREVLIRHTPKPEEVLIEKDDSGDIVRSTTKDTDAIAMYKTMKDTLVYLTHLDYADTEAIMLDKLAKQMDGSEYGWDPLNALCWAVGAISGTMSEEVRHPRWDCLGVSLTHLTRFGCVGSAG